MRLTTITIAITTSKLEMEATDQVFRFISECSLLYVWAG